MSGTQRVRERFEAAKREGRAALVVYLTAGDPSPEATPALLKALEEAGADVVELGVPFSDPNADGPVIQEAMHRALDAGGGLDSAIANIAAYRKAGGTLPIVLFGYYNPILVQGPAEVAQKAGQAGVDAFLTVDVPMDELRELAEPLASCGVGVVPLVAPTSTPDRIANVAGFEPAFVYYVSRTGVTGSAFQGASGGSKRVEEIRSSGGAPVAVGFGIKTPEDAARVAAYADGVVVGSALVKAIAAGSSVEEACSNASTLVAALRGAMGRS